MENILKAWTSYFSHIEKCTWLILDQPTGPFAVNAAEGARRIYSSGFLLGFFGLRERLLALHNGQMGALR